MIDEENVIETIVTPSAPRVVSNEQLYIYMPIVTADSPGISSYEMSQFTIVDGKVSIRNDLFVDVATFNAYVTDMDNNFTSVYETLEKHEHDIASVADNIASVTDDITRIDQDIAAIGDDITRIDQDIAAIGDDIESVHVEIVDTVADLAVVKDLIEDKQFAIAFATYFSAITYFNNLQLQNNNLRVGQNVYIKTQNVPDLWIYSIVDNRVSYTYTTDDAIVDSLRRDGQIQIGYFILSALENKLSLDGYVTDDDLAAESDKLNAAIQTLQTAVDNLESGATSANFQNGVGAGSVQQVPDRVEDGFDFTGKNPNAEAIDHSLSAVQPYGGVGDFSNSFGGKSSAQGKRSHAEGTTTIAKGNYSHAEGDNAVALGADSHAEGYATTAYGTGSHAEGSETVVGAVLAGHLFGDYAHAEGIRTKALMDASHAEGYQTTANGEHSHSEGTDTTAVNTSSHAEGRGTRAGGDGAHSEGVNTETAATAAHAEGAFTKALKAHSHAEGYQTTANGEHSHSEGIGTSTNGAAAHAEGSQSGAYGDYSHAGGIDSQVKGHAAFAHGTGLDANGTSQAVFGEYNANDGDALLEIGNGSSRVTPSTAFRVKRDGRAQASGAALDPEDLVRLDDIDRPVTEHLLFNGSRFVVLAPSIASVNDEYTVRSGKWRLRDISSIDTSKIQGAVLRGQFSSNGMQFTDVVMRLTDSGLTVAYSDLVGRVTTVVLGNSIIEDYLDIEVDYLTAERPRSRLKYSTFTQLFEYVIEYNIYEHNINLTANTNVEIIQDSASSSSRNSDIHCRFTLLHAKSTKLSPGDILNALSLDERSATGYFWNKSIGSVYAIVHSIGLTMDDRLLISGIELDKFRSFCYIDLTSDMYTDDIRVL